MAPTIADECNAEKAYLAMMGTKQGQKQVIAKIAVGVDEIKTDLKAHKAAPAHKAHPWTRDAIIFIAGAVACQTSTCGEGFPKWRRCRS